MGALTDLLPNSTARHALAQRDISAVFRILRDAGVSQIRLAPATGQQQSEISEIISGRQVQSIVLLERIADGLEIPRGWMGLAYAPDLVAEAAAPDDAETEGERRSNLLRHAATLLYGKPVLGPAAPIRAEHTATPVPRRCRAGSGSAMSSRWRPRPTGSASSWVISAASR
jgi:transcriptional regulator with XRE-family HTH domain